MEPARCEGNPPTCTCGRAPGTASFCWDCCWRSSQLGSSLPWEASCQAERAQPQRWSSAARSWWWLRSREKSGAGSKPSQPPGQPGLQDIAGQLAPHAALTQAHCQGTSQRAGELDSTDTRGGGGHWPPARTPTGLTLLITAPNSGQVLLPKQHFGSSCSMKSFSSAN